jgi:hypothetical protein
MISYDTHSITFRTPPGGWDGKLDFKGRLEDASNPRQHLRERRNIETLQVTLPSLDEYDHDPEAA